MLFFCTSYCLLHILLFCTFFYFIAHFTLISPFLTICMPLCYVTLYNLYSYYFALSTERTWFDYISLLIIPCITIMWQIKKPWPWPWPWSRGSGTSKHFRWAKSALCSGRPTLTLSWDPGLDTCLRFPPLPFRDQLVNLQALPSEEADPAFALLCPIRALRIYVDHTRSFRSSEQLFVCHGGQQKCKTVSKQRLAYWMPSPWCTNLKASHAPWGDGSLHWSVASSYALVHGASLADICRAMGGATLNTFAGFYSLCVVSVSSHVFGKR